MRLASRAVLPACALALLLSACTSKPAALAVEDAYVRLPAVPGNPGAAYFRIKGGPAADRLVAVTSDMVPRIELHASAMQGGTMHMTPLGGVDVPAGGKIAFAPAGNHVMLFGLPSTVQKGSQVPLTLRFQSGAVLGLGAKAIAAGDKTPN